MNKLWAFGDSFTFGHGCRPDGPLTEYYYNYKKDGDNVWTNHLGNMLNVEVKNFGICGASNEIIIDTIIENCNFIGENDYVFINKTFNSRMEIPYKKEWIQVFHNCVETNWWKETQFHKFDKETTNTIVDFQYKFLNSKLYKKRHDIRFNFIENVIKNTCKKCIVWDITDSNFINSFETIRQHTHKKIDDVHLSFNGHSELSNLFYKKITNKNII